jgi:hypothetical protein
VVAVVEAEAVALGWGQFLLAKGSFLNLGVDWGVG